MCATNQGYIIVSVYSFAVIWLDSLRKVVSTAIERMAYYKNVFIQLETHESFLQVIYYLL